MSECVSVIVRERGREKGRSLASQCESGKGEKCVRLVNGRGAGGKGYGWVKLGKKSKVSVYVGKMDQWAV